MIKNVINRLRGTMPVRLDSSISVGQKVLSAVYSQMNHSGHPGLALSDTGFRVHSQHEEDGMLLYLFSVIGTSNKRCVEMCCGTGIECNTANLVIHHRWLSLMFDGNDQNIAIAQNFYATHPDSQIFPPVIRKQWITKSNINTIITESGFSGPIDLFSLDVDGVDYWLWEALTAIQPRVVLLEFNHRWGPDESVTVPYADDFSCSLSDYGSDYAGASLRAFVKLGRAKGYRLIGTNAIATNAFFLRDDIAPDRFPEIDPATCFGHPRAQYGMKHRLAAIKDKPWVRV